MVLERRSRCVRVVDHILIILLPSFDFFPRIASSFSTTFSISVQWLTRSCRYSADMAGPTKTAMFFKSRKPFALQTRAMSSRTVPRQSSIASDHDSIEKFSISESQGLSDPPLTIPKAAPLSILPLASIVRSLAITSISSSPVRASYLSN